MSVAAHENSSANVSTFRPRTILIASLLTVLGSNTAEAQCASNCITALPWSGLTYGVSDDGSVVVGHTGATFSQALQWTAGGGVKDLGNLGFNFATAYGVSGDGSVVVGQSAIAGYAGVHAFRWTAGSGMVDLGTLGGFGSTASAVSRDGNVIVGYADTATGLTQAFRWTSQGGMTNLGTLPGATHSYALGVNSDGSVVVGAADFPGPTKYRAFRWSGNDGMRDLGSLSPGANAAALAVSGNGLVIVGRADTAPTGAQFSGYGHAFRWTEPEGMTDLGTLGPRLTSEARGVSADGTVIVGNTSTVLGNFSGNAGVAFRWTSLTGMRDLNALLIGAGVSMSGIVLYSANSISRSGQFIVGDGTFNGSSRGYIVRYMDEAPNPTGSEPTKPFGGVTDIESVQRSINDLASARRAAGVQQHAFAAPLLGADKPLSQTTEVGVFGSVGSLSTGGFARYAFGGDFALLGGLAYSREEYQNVDLYSAKTAALALRYTYSGLGALQPFFEVGGWRSPDSKLRFTRNYSNGSGIASGVGSTEGNISYHYGRGGIAIDLNRANQFVLSGEVGRERLHIGGYLEPLTRANPFEAWVAGGTDAFDVAKLKAQYTAQLTDRLDATLWLAAARSFNETSGLSATVSGTGTFAPTLGSAPTWAEFGARLGTRLTDSATFDVFSGGVSGRDGIGTQIHSGVGIRFHF